MKKSRVCASWDSNSRPADALRTHGAADHWATVSFVTEQVRNSTYHISMHTDSLGSNPSRVFAIERLKTHVSTDWCRVASELLR